MPKNLDEKIALILNDIKRLPDFEVRKRIKDFVLQEVNFTKTEHTLDNYDLSRIQSLAMDLFSKTDFRILDIDQSYQRVWCFVQAVLTFLKSESLIEFGITYDSKKQKK